MKRSTPAIALLLLHAAVALLACEDEVTSGNNAPPPPRRNLAALSASASASAAPSATAPPLTEGDFTRTDSNRDPFFPYAEAIKPPPDEAKKLRAQALADRFSLDELKLVGIITGNTAARAMFIDPEGRGWIVSLGQLLGRAETVKAGGNQGADYELTWKVDRIRENDVVFIRETPGRANIPNATRVVTLRTDDNKRR